MSGANQNINIAIDVMGSEFAPDSELNGIVEFQEQEKNKK